MNPLAITKQFRFLHILTLVATLVLAAPGIAQAWPATNRVPPMGWEPWNFDHCGTMYKWDEAYYEKLADFFVTSGLRDLGYTYLTIECHDHYRDQNGRIQPSAGTFPNGFKVVTAYIHSKGLKVRSYTDAGKAHCGRTFEGPGSFGHYEEDAKQWRSFGFDGVKIDWCGGDQEGLDPETQYTQFADAIKAVLPDFSIEICSGGEGGPWTWGRSAGTFWRTEGDIDNTAKESDWPSTRGADWNSLLRNIDANRHPSKKFVGPGKGWNYPDMLEVGVPGGLDEMEERTQFSMWAVMAAPLFLGNDVFNMPAYAKEIIMNKEVIAVDQDPLGIQGDVVKESGGGKIQVWSKKLEDGSRAVALLNRDSQAREMTVSCHDLGFLGKCHVRDLWLHADKGSFASQYRVQVPSHGVVLLKISPVHGS